MYTLSKHGGVQVITQKGSDGIVHSPIFNQIPSCFAVVTACQGIVVDTEGTEAVLGYHVFLALFQ